MGIAWQLNKRTVLRGGRSVLRSHSDFGDASKNSASTESCSTYVILNPTFYPGIPSARRVASDGAAQQTRPSREAFARRACTRRAPASSGIEPDVAAHLLVNSRGVHLLNVRDLDQSRRLLTESAGVSRQNQVVANLNANYRKITVFGNYALSYGRDDNEGLPADPNNLRAEWGPSSYGDVRHRAVVAASVPAWGKFVVSPFLVVNSGPPYNITTGLDPNHTGTATGRPGLVAGPCQGAGCFNLNPAPGTEIEHNYGRGPGAINVAMRLSRTWTFGPGRAAAPADTGGGHGGPMALSTPGDRRYGLTLSASTMNALNHVNFAPPNGDLSSPYFGQYRALGE